MRPDREDLMTIFAHDVAFWLGDLNYRLQDVKIGASPSIAAVKQLCSVSDFNSLAIFDQVRRHFYGNL